MNISLHGRWEDLVASLVRQGRFGSAKEAVLESLRLLEEREKKLLSLRATIESSIAEGGRLTEEEVSADLDALTIELANEAR